MSDRGRKRGFIFFLLAVLPGLVSAQDLSVEDIYLQQSAEIQIIRDLSADTGRDLKETALDYIGEIVGRGNADDDVREILAGLTLDGIRNQVRLNGRVINNFPDLRIRAVNYLADIGTPEANASLLYILELTLQVSSVAEDPSIITAAIKGLAKIGLDDNKSLRTINEVFLRYNTLKPDNALAMATVSAIDRFVAKGIKDEASIGVLMTIQVNYEYIKFVRAKATEVLAKLRNTK
jgi:HEAT repeat protein